MNDQNIPLVKNIALLVLFLSIGTISMAQRGWEAGPWAGVSYYFGDLNTSYNLSKPQFAAGMIARYNFNNRLALKFSGNYGYILADDADSKNIYERARNLSFESPIIDASAQFEFNFLPYVHGSQEEYFTPYLFAGLSAFYFNPQAELNGELYELRALGTEGQFKGEEYFTVQGALNFGIGLKLDLSYEWSLNFELSVRQTFTDYLDDVSTIYPDESDLLRARGELAVQLSDRSITIPGVVEETLGIEGRQRGDSSTNDSYLFLGVGLVYYFGDLRCPGYGRNR
ncbi:MAG: outer membrane beta-barrel protein [Saprospiraceae bacterium]|nr:outer membrane beta-barrel protein [Saprospiraceae bacterium]